MIDSAFKCSISAITDRKNYTCLVYKPTAVPIIKFSNRFEAITFININNSDLEVKIKGSLFKDLIEKALIPNLEMG